jgi:hypothetical protein
VQQYPQRMKWVIGYRPAVVVLVAVTALTVLDSAVAKEISTTTCGRNECRTVTNGISGVATLWGRIPAPRGGRFYTVSLRVESGGWKIVYEAQRQIVRALDSRARSFLGRGWARLSPGLRAQYVDAVRGLAPMRSAPPYIR